jgi:hypothetical protein
MTVVTLVFFITTIYFWAKYNMLLNAYRKQVGLKKEPWRL